MGLTASQTECVLGSPGALLKMQALTQRGGLPFHHVPLVLPAAGVAGSILVTLGAQVSVASTIRTCQQRPTAGPALPRLNLPDVPEANTLGIPKPVHREQQERRISTAAPRTLHGQTLLCVPHAPWRLLMGLRPVDCSGPSSVRAPQYWLSPLPDPLPTPPTPVFPGVLKNNPCTKTLVSECASGGAGPRQRWEVLLLSATLPSPWPLPVRHHCHPYRKPYQPQCPPGTCLTFSLGLPPRSWHILLHGSHDLGHQRASSSVVQGPSPSSLELLLHSPR